MNEVYKKLEKAYESIKSRIPFKPKVGLVLGSGLGDFADEVEIIESIDYKDIEGFPVSSAPGHKGRYVFCRVNGTETVCMQGRVHYYEGYDMEDVVLPIRTMGMMGCKYLFVTNASGGINYGFNAGDLMIITDHMSFLLPSPLRGPNVSGLGVRFPDMSHVYRPELVDLIKKSARKLDIELKEGVYAQTAGPQYETPAEIRALRTMGADAVGMSTAVEAVAANHMGMKVLGISCISNLAAGIQKTPLSEQEVLDAGKAVAPKFKRLVSEIIGELK